MGYRVLPAVTVPGFRVGIVKDERFFHAESLYFRTKAEVEARAWPEVSYEVGAVDLGAMSLNEHERLHLGDRVLVTDETLGLCLWVRLTRVRRRLEKPQDVTLEFETKVKGVGDFLALYQSQINDPSPDSNILPDPAGGDPGNVLVIGPDGGVEWSPTEQTHTHVNLPTLEVIEDIGSGSEGQVLTVRSGEARWDDTAATHTHVNLPTLEKIEDIASGSAGDVLTKDASGNAVWEATAATHSHANLTTLNGIAALTGVEVGKILTVSGTMEASWSLPDAQKLWLGEVSAVNVSGSEQLYSVLLIDSADKVVTGETLTNCVVPDDAADPLVTGQGVVVCKPSAAGIAAGERPIIVGLIGPQASAPAHAHVTDRWGYTPAWEG